MAASIALFQYIAGDRTQFAVRLFQNLLNPILQTRRVGHQTRTVPLANLIGHHDKERVKPNASDVVMYKHRFSGFYGTEPNAVLKRSGVTNLMITGCTASVCVEFAVRDAMFRLPLRSSS